MTREVFTKKRLVAYHETDPMRVVHHSVYLLWLEDMRFQLAQELLGLNYIALTDHERFFFGVRKANVEYISSCRYEDEVRIAVWLTHPHPGVLNFYFQIDRRRAPHLCESSVEDHWERAIFAEISNVIIDASTWKIVDELPPYLQQSIEYAKEHYPWAFLEGEHEIDNLTQFRRKVSTKRFREMIPSE